MLVVKPNPRQMRYMRDSPSEGPGRRRGRVITELRWRRVLLAAGVVCAIVAGSVALMSHF